MKGWRKILVISTTVISYSLFFLYLFRHFDYQQYTINDYIGILCFLILLILVASFPINIKGTDIFFAQAVTVAIFLQYGFMIEVILSQLCIFYFLIMIKANTWDRYAINGTMFLFVSAGSALVFYALGGQLHHVSEEMPDIPILPVIGYILSNIMINHTMLYFIQNKIRNVNKDWFGKDFWWEVIPVTLITPTGILIYMLYSQLQVMAIVYVTIPIVTFSIIFRLYNKLDIVNQKLKTINQTGNIMTGKLEMDHVAQEFVQSVAKLVPYQYCYLFKMDDSQHRLIPIHLLGDDLTEKDRLDFMRYSIEVGDGLSGIVAQTSKSIRIGHEKDDIHFKNEPSFLRHQNSILSVPLIRNHQTVGVITLSHSETNKYTKEDATLVEILANQAAIAFKNADQYEETKRKSERDELTGLYNYRYFEHLLFEKMKEAQQSADHLSLIILDIDYFKHFNDRYGHLAGNSILRQLADLLQQVVGENGIITRYGGEEFTVLFSGLGKEESFMWGERIREQIEQASFEIEQDLEQGETRGKTEDVSITVSVGLAVYPEHADDPLNLVRHADRAMYTGAKRQGRNKVAMYHAG